MLKDVYNAIITMRTLASRAVGLA